MGLTELLHSGQAGIGRAEGAQISGGEGGKLWFVIDYPISR